MTDADTDSDLEELRRRRRRELREQVDGDSDGGDQPDGSATPAEPVFLENAAGFEPFVTDHDLVLVDFFADWCGPCKQLDPIVAELAEETAAAVLKVDIDAHPELAAAENVRGVPTLVLYSGGEPAERVVGLQGKERLQSLLERYDGSGSEH